MQSNSKTGAWQIFLIFLRLGLTSFGGPVAHIGFFRHEFVERRRWLDERAYADLVALCQFLPGPASSQVGMALGLMRSGHPGALAAWLGFTLPSALFMIFFALGVVYWSEALESGWLQGLKIAALAVIVQALWGMARSLCPDGMRVSFMLFSACLMLIWPWLGMPVIILLIAALAGYLFKLSSAHPPAATDQAQTGRMGWSILGVFFALLILLPILAWVTSADLFLLFDSFYRAGSLVFGGGHVVLPLLQQEMVETGRVSHEVFLAGYGAVQAMPGPLFTFAGYLGAASTSSLGGVMGGMLALIAVFLPSYLLILAVLPAWQRLRTLDWIQSSLAGVNAAVVGLLLAAVYQPVWITSVQRPEHLALALFAWVALTFWRCPVWLLVPLCAFAGALFF
ncbi:chromate efflux transporter [Nitrincola tapanii]|uniref:Chromate efflux transporter n=1 Tax=Nitrincola tapanii TaxID=1708751 RepID=A0A5A9W0H2_9GAMM|nr:chromate efflux transporter [Nitrincola tapanii]KAA0874226.1 chromate efflux transporter [Nitrincola tapanii]